MNIAYQDRLGQDVRKNVQPVEVMQFMTHNSLHLYKKKGSSAPLQKRVEYEKSENQSSYKKGTVFVSCSKTDLSQGRGFLINSYESLHENHSELTHWTPNTYRGGTYYDFGKRVIKGHTRDNLKQINVIGFDIDTKDIDLYSVFLGCEELGLPWPNVLLETPKGFQGFFVLETPFYIHKQKDFKALRIAERLSENMLKALEKYVPIDVNCAPFGFYRIPKQDNVVYFGDQPANTSKLLTWSKKFEEEEKRASFQVIYSKGSAASNQTSSAWYQALIQATQIESGHYSSSRNNAVLTLAIANFASGRPFDEAYDELDQFNSNLAQPLGKTEFERILKSAYSGKYKGAKRTYVEGLLELWTDGKTSFQGRDGWYKFKKPREERVRSHYDEREQDILQYVEKVACPEKPFFEGALKALAERFGMAVSTLKEVLKRSSKLIKRTVGRGRNAVTKITSRSMLFKSLLLARRERVQLAQLSFAQLLPSSREVISEEDLPSIQSELLTQEVDLIYRSGASQPVKMTS